MAGIKKQLDPKVKKIFSETEVGVLLEEIEQQLGSLADGQKMIQQTLNIVSDGQKILDTVWKKLKFVLMPLKQ